MSDLSSPRKSRRSARSVRIDDVAREAGVSPITASRALGRPEMVSEKTRQAVRNAVERTGYIPNRLAGGLASNSSKTVGVVLPFIRNPAYSERMEAMIEVLSAEGFQPLIGLSGFSQEAELRHAREFLGQRVVGLAFSSAAHAPQLAPLVLQAGVPVVELNIIDRPLIDMGVGYSHKAAARAMIEHLARCGYRKIALVSTPTADDQLTQDRVNGYHEGVAQYGLVQHELLHREAAPGLAGGARAFVEVLATHPDLDAVFCTSDFHAIGCILEAKRRGISVPDDIGVAGYDDLEISQEFIPTVTTVRVPRRRMGRLAAEMLLSRIKGLEVPARVVDVGYEIVPRASTRRPKSGS